MEYCKKKGNKKDLTRSNRKISKELGKICEMMEIQGTYRQFLYTAIYFQNIKIET